MNDLPNSFHVDAEIIMDEKMKHLRSEKRILTTRDISLDAANAVQNVLEIDSLILQSGTASSRI